MGAAQGVSCKKRARATVIDDDDELGEEGEEGEEGAGAGDEDSDSDIDLEVRLNPVPCSVGYPSGS